MNGLSKYYIKKIINCFSAEMTATATSQKLKINRNTVNKYYKIIREAVTDYQESLTKLIKVDKEQQTYYFSWHRHKGLSFDSSQGTVCFCLLEKDDKVYIKRIASEDIPEDQYGHNKATLNNNEAVHSLVNEYISSGNGNGNGNSMQYNGNTRTNSVYSINEDGNGYEEKSAFIVSDTVNEFMYYAREKLAKFYGVKPEYTYLYLKELEFRFNNKTKDIARIILRILPHHSKKVH